MSLDPALLGGTEQDPFAGALHSFAQELIRPRQALDRDLLSPEEWLDDPFYSGDLGWFDATSETGCWPSTREAFLSIVRGWEEIGFTGAFGVGKTQLAILLITYWLYELSCYASPQALMGVQEHSVLVFMLVHMNQRKAEAKLYGPLRSAIQRIPYFKDQFPPNPRITSYLEFGKGLKVYTGVTDPDAVRSHDLVGLVVDEANFLDVTKRSARDKEGRTFDAAEEIVEAAVRRQTSRFKSTSLWLPRRVILSSRDRPHDFLERRERETRESAEVEVIGPPEDQLVRNPVTRRAYLSKALWSAKPRWSGKKWPGFTVEIGGDGRRSRILREGEKPVEGSRLIRVPDEFLPEFTKNTDEALRELAGIAIAGVGRLFPDDRVVLAAFTRSYNHPMTRQATTLQDGVVLVDELLFKDGAPICCPKKWRFGHGDPAESQDSYGLCFVHAHDVKIVEVIDPKDPTKKLRRPAPVFKVDLALEVLPPRDGEIRLALVEQLVYDLQDRGMKIGYLTFDGHQSLHTRQNMEARGIPVERRSVDAKPDSYLDLRSAFEEDRVVCYEHPELMKQLTELIYYRALGKVDHPPRSCFTGETRVVLADGTHPTFEELSHRPADEVFYVYSMGDDGVVVAPAGHARVTKVVTEVVEVTLDNHQVVRCTPDHLFMTIDGDWVQASAITAGVRLMPLYRTVNEIGGWAVDVRLVQVPATHVYDLTVPVYENFALACGVFVHNSKDTADALCGAVANAVQYGAFAAGEVGPTFRAKVYGEEEAA